MKLLASAAALILAAGTAQAATLLSFPKSNNVASVTGTGGTLSAVTGSLYADGSYFCGIGPDGCTGDFTLTFTQAVTNVKFSVIAANPGDQVAVSIFNGASLSGDVTVTTDGIYNLTSFGTITKLFFDDQFFGFGGPGVIYDSLTYDLAAVEPTPPSAVPVPASLPLLAAGLAGLAALRRRKA